MFRFVLISRVPASKSTFTGEEESVKIVSDCLKIVSNISRDLASGTIDQPYVTKAKDWITCLASAARKQKNLSRNAFFLFISLYDRIAA